MQPSIDCVYWKDCTHWRVPDDGIGFKSCQHPHSYFQAHITLANEVQAGKCTCGNNGGGDCDWCHFFTEANEECEGYKPR